LEILILNLYHTKGTVGLIFVSKRITVRVSKGTRMKLVAMWQFSAPANTLPEKSFLCYSSCLNMLEIIHMEKSREIIVLERSRFQMHTRTHSKDQKTMLEDEEFQKSLTNPKNLK
jgi:hypothetical protein